MQTFWQRIRLVSRNKLAGTFRLNPRLGWSVFEKPGPDQRSVYAAAVHRVLLVQACLFLCSFVNCLFFFVCLLFPKSNGQSLDCQAGQSRHNLITNRMHSSVITVFCVFTLGPLSRDKLFRGSSFRVVSHRLKSWKRMTELMRQSPLWERDHY